jgi:hypothetical protein
MSVWLSESEYRQSGATQTGLTINVAFLQEIKEDVRFQDLIESTRQHFVTAEAHVRNRPIDTARVLNELRDELETYFALEEFYGYFQNAEVVNPSVSHQADSLKKEHEELFLELSKLIDSVEQIVYRENSPDLTFATIARDFEHFITALHHHEQKEMELVMRLYNEEIGVGD